MKRSRAWKQWAAGLALAWVSSISGQADAQTPSARDTVQEKSASATDSGAMPQPPGAESPTHERDQGASCSCEQTGKRRNPYRWAILVGFVGAAVAQGLRLRARARRRESKAHVDRSSASRT